jgi:hypothetical protein
MSSRAFYGGTGGAAGVALTGDQDVEGVKTMVDGLRVGNDDVRIVIDDLGDTQGMWLDATLADAANPNISFKLRAKGPSGQIQTHSPLDAVEGLLIEGAEVTAATINGAAQKSANLSDLTNATTARTNLGLGTSATRALLFAALSADAGSITSNTTLANVTGLYVAVAANKVYMFDLVAYFDAGPTGDSKWGLTFPAGATGTWSGSPAKNAADTASNFAAVSIATTIAGGATNSGTVVTAHYTGLIRTAGTAGAVQVQVAQQATDATALIVKADSHLLLREVA